jgi:hypothetical protein
VQQLTLLERTGRPTRLWNAGRYTSRNLRTDRDSCVMCKQRRCLAASVNAVINREGTLTLVTMESSHNGSVSDESRTNRQHTYRPSW